MLLVIYSELYTYMCANIYDRGVEHLYKKHFQQFDIHTKVGYIGGNTTDPDYRKVADNTHLLYTYDFNI